MLKIILVAHIFIYFTLMSKQNYVNKSGFYSMRVLYKGHLGTIDMKV